jgi:uncharacterized membrane protein
MVFAIGLVSAVCLGFGWVVQQRVAAHAALSELLSWRLIRYLAGKPVWWVGIAAMSAGAALGGWALQLGTVTLVEPLLSANLLFAFLFAALLNRTRVQLAELIGALLLSAALGVFIAVGDPQAADHPRPSLWTAILALDVVATVVAALVAVAKRSRLRTQAVLIATGAGLLYGLQDAATRASLVGFDDHGIKALLVTPWPYVVVASAAVGILLTQSAFRLARLDYSLPPTAAAEPIAGVAIGITVLGDTLSVDAGALAAETLCLLAMVAGVVLIGRSASLSPARASRADSP